MSTRTILATIIALGLTASPPSAHAFKCMPIYGNWCGANYPPEGTAPPPINAFDAACMRHDLCIAGPGPDNLCDMAFVGELHSLAVVHGHLPRPLQWAEYAIRLKSGGPMTGMPMPTPWDLTGFMSSIAAPCW